MTRTISLEKNALQSLDYTNNESTGAVLNALSRLFAAESAAASNTAGEAAGSESDSVIDAIRTIADGVLKNASLADTEHLANFELGKGMYCAYAVTGNEEYRNYAKTIAGQLKTQPRYEDGIFKGSHDGGVRRPCRTYMYTPFYMTYETLDGGKEQYNDIIAQIRAYRTNVFDEYAAKLGKDPAAYNIIAHFAAAMIDTMEAMDQMLYEIYHELMDYYRDAVRAVIDSGVVQNEGTKADFVFGYAVLKGCRMKALHTEKYEGLVIGLTDKFHDDVDIYTLAFQTLFYSEAIRNREYQDYGRGKGGVLWS